VSRPTIFTPAQLATIGKRVAAGETSQAIAGDFGVDRKTILHVVRWNNLGPWKSKVVPDQSRDMPADFAEHATEPMKDLKKRYSAGDPNIRKWRQQLAVTVSLGPKIKQMPADFAEVQQGKSILTLAEHYGCGKLPVSRWLKELGIQRERFVSAAPVNTPAKPAHLVRNAYMTTPVDRALKDGSRAGLAADFLRKFGPVWKCNDRGSPDIAGSHWRRGSSILTDAEIIERAQYNGWSADAWKRVA
jgi:hypothetical protein